MKKHFTKFLPLALAMVFATTGSAFAEYTPGTTASQADYEITVPEYLNIIKTAELKESSNVTSFSADYTTINLDTAMQAAFTVYNNKPGTNIYLRGSAKADTGKAVPALGGTAADAIWLVFTNDDRKPSASAITSAITASGTDAAANPNCIAFDIEVETGAVSGTAASAAPGAVIGADGGAKSVVYTLQNGGYTFNYDFAQTAKTGTFSTHDTNGTYKATLYLTTVAQL